MSSTSTNGIHTSLNIVHKYQLFKYCAQLKYYLFSSGKTSHFIQVTMDTVITISHLSEHYISKASIRGLSLVPTPAQKQFYIILHMGEGVTKQDISQTV